MDDHSSKRLRRSNWLLIVLGVPIAYLLSSGSILALSFWLREATGWDGFYGVLWLYFPLLVFHPDNLIENYIEWWVNLFGTVGPG